VPADKQFTKLIGKIAPPRRVATKANPPKGISFPEAAQDGQISWTTIQGLA
jgi:hypothetical protein